jgi:D-serine deaminase-like pyridoxal phosphate-dependent protein
MTGRGVIPNDVYASYERAFAELTTPFAFVDLDALDANAKQLTRQARGIPIRVASKSVRCRAVLEHVLAAHPGFRGVLAFTPAEALFLADHGVRDALVAYPSTDVAALSELGRRAKTVDSEQDSAIVSLVDSAETLVPVLAAAREHGVRLPVCIDIDAGWWPLDGQAGRAGLAGRIGQIGRAVRIGPKRSPVRTPEQAADLARMIEAAGDVQVVGIMAYDGQIAGVGDRPPGRPFRGAAVRAMQAASLRDLTQRLPAVVAAVRSVIGRDLRFVNGGGTGSLARIAAAGAVDELAAGSGLYAPTLFDAYDSLSLRPAAMFVLPVVRRPGPGVVTALGGGYIASGPPGADRVPVPVLPAGLRLDRDEGAGEVQTPLLGPAADRLRIGDRVYFRHAKAGELAERFARLFLVRGGLIVDEVPTYRGEGQTFL